MACLGWTSLVVIPEVQRVFEQSQNPGFAYHGFGRVGVIMAIWFIFGVILVALDTFRQKTSWEKTAWRVAVVLFGLSAAWMVISSITGLMRVVSYQPHPIEFILTTLFVITALIGNPIYTLLLTYRAMRSWDLFLRSG